MVIYKVNVSEPAEEDLLDITHYISTQLYAPAIALNMLSVIENALTGLEYMPQKYQIVADERLASLGYRYLTVKNYLVFFTIDESANIVNIERVLYARRDWQRLI